MHALLLAGLGASHKNADYFKQSLFQANGPTWLPELFRRAGEPNLRLDGLTFRQGDSDRRLLRPRGRAVHLTTSTLLAILERSSHTCTLLDLEFVWQQHAAFPPGDADLVLLSTTFIWNENMLAQVMAWVRESCPGLPIVLGGQYSNLKFKHILMSYRDVVAVVRGDAEVALPLLMDTLQARGNLSLIPNLVWRDGEDIRINALDYVDLDAIIPPSFPFQTAAYESMRGCPFDCKFCSFPAASPRWRYRSAAKIKEDWLRYGELEGVTHIEAMDSTFTVPPARLRTLFAMLPSAGVPTWSCYSRANVLDSPAVLESLAEAHCVHLEIGFESMNDATLARMSKRVNASQNRRAFEFLRGSSVGYGVNFMVGYPGESPDDFATTRDFLAEDFVGRFGLHVFSISDETMPLWADRETLQIDVANPADPDSSWRHVGMTSDDARSLQWEALDEVRRKNDRAVPSLWQRQFDQPLLPLATESTNLAVEKALERLAMVQHDYAVLSENAVACVQRQLRVLRDSGLKCEVPEPHQDDPARAVRRGTAP